MSRVLFRHIADMSNPHSLLNRVRRRRIALFLALLEQLPRPLRILDVGGTQYFWHTMRFSPDDQLEITVLNTAPLPMCMPRIQMVVGNGCQMGMFPDKTFDVVFCNSVIEHVASYENQQAMSEEIKRVGKRYFVQTPNRSFPIEPHFLFPFFQFLPVWARVWLLQHFSLGWYRRIPNYEEARQEVSAIRLLSKREMMSLFPEANLRQEKVLGYTSSWIAYFGWE